MSTFDLIVQSIPQRFRPEKAQNNQSIFHFDISGEGYPFTVVIANGMCQLTQGLNGRPNCVVKTKAKTYVQLELGEANPQMALMMGKVKVSNLAAMLEFSKLFRKFKAETNYNTDASLPKSTERKPASGPLQGLRVIDLTRLLPGPVATMMMADMGADVIKVEDPDAPDYIRNFAPFKGTQAAYYLTLNRSKRSLAINYRNEAGKAALKAIVKTADVLIEQFRPGVMESMGLGYEELKAINPKLVYVSITGYGQTGPYAQRAGHDLNYLALSGLLSLNGTADEKVIPGFQIADVAGGGYMAINAALAALFSRSKTGLGQHVDVAMMDASLPLATLAYAEMDATGTASEAGDHQLSGHLANYNVYKTSDGKFMALGALEPKFWNIFCDAVEHPEWKDLILSKGATLAELKAAVSNLFLSKDAAHWTDLGLKYDCCLTPVLSIGELQHDAHMQHRKLIQNGQINTPLLFSDTKTKQHWPAPKLGEDTLSILREANIKESTLQHLANAGVIKYT